MCVRVCACTRVSVYFACMCVCVNVSLVVFFLYLRATLETWVHATFSVLTQVEIYSCCLYVIQALMP